MDSNIEIKEIDITVPDPWVQVTYLNAWTGDMFYAKLYDGSVQMRGFVETGAYGTSAFQLPMVCRPPQTIVIPTTSAAATGVGALSMSGSNAIMTPTIGTGKMQINHRFMPADNVPSPLSCFPIDVKTRFKTSPKAVVTIGTDRWSKDTKKPQNQALNPSWRFVMTAEGPTVQIIDIQGLEYGSRQKVTVAIIGGQ